MTTELFLFLCKKVELRFSDMEVMTIGMCLEYIECYIEYSNPSENKRVKKAGQREFDSF